MILSEQVKSCEEEARRLAVINGAPYFPLTELVVSRAHIAAELYGANLELVQTALFLAHVVFSTEIGGEVQRDHAERSAILADEILRIIGVDTEDITHVQNIIRRHHLLNIANSTEEAAFRNTEPFKFVSPIGGILFRNHLVLDRYMTMDEAGKEAIRKAEQKLPYVTHSDLAIEAMHGVGSLRAEIHG